jgi:hypothetical protein
VNGGRSELFLIQHLGLAEVKHMISTPDWLLACVIDDETPAVVTV